MEVAPIAVGWFTWPNEVGACRLFPINFRAQEGIREWKQKYNLPLNSSLILQRNHVFLGGWGTAAKRAINGIVSSQK